MMRVIRVVKLENEVWGKWLHPKGVCGCLTTARSYRRRAVSNLSHPNSQTSTATAAVMRKEEEILVCYMTPGECPHTVVWRPVCLLVFVRTCYHKSTKELEQVTQCFLFPKYSMWNVHGTWCRYHHVTAACGSQQQMDYRLTFYAFISWSLF